MSHLRDLIAKHEGYSDKPYTDTVGKLTIGYGRNLEEKGISKDMAEAMLDEDLEDAKREAMQFDWFDALNEPRQAVIISMIFNMGMPRFKGFKQTIFYISKGLYNAAADEMLQGTGPGGKSRWYSQVGRRAEELADMMRSGDWPGEHV